MGGDHWVLGVDVGTSRSAGAMANGTVTPLEVEGNRWMPSMVLLDPDGHLVVGSAADHQAGVYPDRVERTPKRYIGGAAPLLLGGQPVAVQDAIGRLIEVFLDEGRLRQGGQAPAVTILTHPVRWGTDRREALAESARRIGLEELILIEEPVAAAAHYVGDRVEVGQYVGVYDLGGGTFDTAILQRTAGGFETVGVPLGDEVTGGEHFDHLIFDYLGECIADDDPDLWEQIQYGEDRRWTRAAADLLTQARRAKEAVSSYPSTQVLLPLVDRDVVFTRVQFEAMVRDALEGTVAEMADTVASAGLQPDDLEAIYLVGGSSRIPLVTQLMTEAFGDRIKTRDEPKSVVALGAATVGRSRVEAAPDPSPAPGSMVGTLAPERPGPPPPATAALPPPPSGVWAPPAHRPPPAPPASAPPRSGFAPLWQLGFQAPTGPLRPAGRSCFVTDSSALVHEVDLSGSWRWAVRLPAPATGRPVLVGETLAVPCGTLVVGVDTRHRTVRFQAPLSGRISNDPVWAGVILVADETGMVSALDHAGTPRWMLPLPSRAVAPATLAGDSVLVATTDGPVYRVVAATGVAAWAFPAPAGVVAPPVLAGPGAVVATTDGTVYAIDGATGRAAWGARLGSSVDGAMAVRETTVVVAASDGSVTALSLRDGSQVWRTDIGLVARAGLSVSGPYLVAWSADGTVVAMDGDRGQVAHRHRVDGPVTDLHCAGGMILLTSGQTLRALRLTV